MKLVKTFAGIALLSGVAIGSLSANNVLAASKGENGLVPAVQSGLYYKLGGGEDVPLPAFYDTSYLPLNAGSNVGLGFDCGIFNPKTALTDSLNEIKSSFLAVKEQVLQDATGAVTEFPLYELSRADPNLYNLITDAMTGAQEDIAVSTKSCEAMQSQIAAGQNPYAHWGQIALGNRWQQDIGTAELSGKGDINQAREDASKDAGKSGVPWVDPDSDNNGKNTDAGGLNQAPIHVINDTAMAGYHVILEDSDNQQSRLQNNLDASQSELVKIFPTPQAAAKWIVNVVGDQTITTYNGGEKASQPGVGLYTDIQSQTQHITPKLQSLVTGATPLTIDNLLAISPEGMALSPEIIHDIQNQPKVIQGIVINKLAQNIAAMTVINKARLAIRILQSGGRIPAIYSNQAAQENLNHAVHLLQQDVQDILTFIQARQTLMSNMLSTMVEAGQSQQAQNTAVSAPSPNTSVLKNGAISSKD